MTLFRRINTTTGDFIEECVLNTHPYLMDTVLQDITDEEGNVTQHEVEQYVTTPVEVEQLTEDGLGTEIVIHNRPVLDPQYVEERWPEPMYTPRYIDGSWVEGGQAPEPTPPVLTDVDRIVAMEEALDFLLMGGM